MQRIHIKQLPRCEHWLGNNLITNSAQKSTEVLWLIQQLRTLISTSPPHSLAKWILSRNTTRGEMNWRWWSHLKQIADWRRSPGLVGCGILRAHRHCHALARNWNSHEASCGVRDEKVHLIEAEREIMAKLHNSSTKWAAAISGRV
jgi:hypothetical protein